MAQQEDNNHQENGRYNVPIRVLRSETKKIISSLLNPKKLFKSEKGLSRDWEGLAELCKIPSERTPSLQGTGVDQCAKILEWWAQSESATVEIFLAFLEDLDRYDIIDDIAESLESDINHNIQYPQGLRAPPLETPSDLQLLTTDDVDRYQQNLPLQNYDCFVLYADEDIQFATEIITKMENEYNFRFCTIHRDLLVGVSELESIINLIATRCDKLIVILSQAFTNSYANTFFYNFAQSLSIEQRRTKILPCTEQNIRSPDFKLPANMSVNHVLDKNRVNSYGDYFWTKLQKSIIAGTKQEQKVPVRNQNCRLSSYLDISQERDDLTHSTVDRLSPKSQIVKFAKSTSDIPDASANGDLGSTNSITSTSVLNIRDNNNSVKKQLSFLKKIKKIVLPKEKLNVKTSDQDSIVNGDTLEPVVTKKKEKKLKLFNNMRRKEKVALEC